MLTAFDIFALVFGLLAGCSLAFLHGWLSRRAIERVLDTGARAHAPVEPAAVQARFAVHGLLRVLLVAVALAALVSISNGSLLAGLLGFLLGKRVAVRTMHARMVG